MYTTTSGALLHKHVYVTYKVLIAGAKENLVCFTYPIFLPAHEFVLGVQLLSKTGDNAGSLTQQQLAQLCQKLS